MKTPVVNVPIDQGETLEIPLRLLAADGSPEDLSDWSALSAKLGSAPGGTVYGTGEVEADDLSVGELRVIFPPSITILATGSTAAWDLWGVDPAGRTVALARGPACPVSRKVGG